MRIFRILLLFLIFINSALSFGQIPEPKFRELNETSYQLIRGNDSINPYYISKNPITNREYITYLCWLADVYADYPEILIKAFPDLGANFRDSLLTIGYSTNHLQTLINISTLTRDYIFNPRYIDYPVTGVSWGQAMNFLNWFSDRYNESILIKRKFLTFYPYQKNKACFTTESYLAEQYVGFPDRLVYVSATKSERPVKWEDRLLIPSFRLPSESEIDLLIEINKTSFISYKHSSFLDYWINYYIAINKNKITLTFAKHDNMNIELSMGKTFQIPSSNIKELFLVSNSKANNSDIFEIFASYGQPKVVPDLNNESNWKDTFGHMPYVIISEDNNLNPVFIKRKSDYEFVNELNETADQFCIFRYALSAVKK